MLKLSPRLQSSSSPFTGSARQKQPKLHLFLGFNLTFCGLAAPFPPPSIQMETPPLVISAASVLKELCYQNKEELQAGFITAGWDSRKGPQVRRACRRRAERQRRPRGCSTMSPPGCSSGLRGVSGGDAGQAAGHHRRFGQHFHLWIR